MNQGNKKRLKEKQLMFCLTQLFVVGYFQLIRIYQRNVMLNLVQHQVFLDPEMPLYGIPYSRTSSG